MTEGIAHSVAHSGLGAVSLGCAFPCNPAGKTGYSPHMDRNLGCKSLLAFAASSFALVHAQDRTTTAGRVLDPHGEPLPNATVTFAGTSPALDDRFTAADYVTAVTQTNGRFRVKLRQQHDYSCWVVGPRHADGHRMVSAVRDVLPGSGFEITVSESRPATRLTVTGTEAWKGIANLRFEAAVSAAHSHRERLRFNDGTALLPTLPTKQSLLLFVSDGEGRLIYAERLRPANEDVHFSMPPPQQVAVRVKDDKGTPVAGATIYVERGARARRSGRILGGHRRLAEWRQVGETGIDGSALVTVANRGDPLAGKGHAMFRASKLGHQDSIGGWNGQIIIDGAGADTGKVPPKRTELPFTLRPAEPWCGTMRDETGAPLADIGLELTTVLTMRLASGSGLFHETSFRTTTDTDGKFTLPKLPEGLTTPTLVIDHSHPPALLEPALDKPFELDLRSVFSVEIEVTAVSGDPARAAQVMLLPLPIGTRKLSATTYRDRLDNRGRMTVRAQRGKWALFVTDRVGFANVLIDAGTPSKLDVQLQDLATMRGRVLVNEGFPVSKLRFSTSSSSSSRVARTGVAAALPAIGRLFNQWLVPQAAVAEDGSFTVRFLDVPGSHYSGRVRAGSKSEKIRFEATGEPVEIDLRLK